MGHGPSDTSVLFQNLTSHKNMNSDLTNEELSLVEFQEASGGIVWWLVLGLCLILAVAH